MAMGTRKQREKQEDFVIATTELGAGGEGCGGVGGGVGDRGVVKGQGIGIDATTLEANAAMRSIVRGDTGASYEEFLRGLAKASGIATPTREDLARLDRKRKKRTSNKEVEESGGRGCADREDEGRAHASGA